MLNQSSLERILQCLVEEKYIVKLLRDLEKGTALETRGGMQLFSGTKQWSQTHPINRVTDTNMN